jgi:hypothetical protein
VSRRLLVAGAPLVAALAAAPAALGVGLSVTPPRLIVPAGLAAEVVMTNPGPNAETYTLDTGNYTIRPDGRVVVDPALPPARSAKRWISVLPRTLRLDPGRSATVTVVTRRVRIAAPGDHQAVVLATAGAPASSGVSVRARVGIPVLVRVPGGITREISVAKPRVVVISGSPALRLRLRNIGNVNERLLPGQIQLQVVRRGRVVRRVAGPARTLLPGGVSFLTVPYRGPAGAVTLVARVRYSSRRAAGPGIRSVPAPVVRRVRAEIPPRR